MSSVDSEGNVGPACKATGFMTSDEYIAAAMNRHLFWWTRSHPVVQAAERNLVKSIPHCWWQRYCVLCDKACEIRDAAKHRE